jgi:hypothetical protein
LGKTIPIQFDEIKRKMSSEYADDIKIECHYVARNLKKKGSENAKQKWKDISEKFHYFQTTDNPRSENLWHTGIASEQYEEGHIINVFYYDTDVLEYGISAGTAFIYGVTEVSGVECKIYIPKTTGNEVFRHKLEDDSEVISNGGLTVHLPINTSEDVSLMHTNILKLIEVSLLFPESRSIHSQWDENSKEYKGIIVNANVKQALHPGGIIYEDVLLKHKMKLTLKKSLGRVPKKIVESGHLKYASISW